jgi:hypothetical protein
MGPLTHERSILFVERILVSEHKPIQILPLEICTGKTDFSKVIMVSVPMTLSRLCSLFVFYSAIALLVIQIGMTASRVVTKLSWVYVKSRIS